MSQLIQFLSQGSSEACKKAIAPVVYQGELSIAIGTGSTPLDLLAPLAAGDTAAFGGQIVNSGCNKLLASITYLTGDDCNSCTSDTLTTSVIDVIVPKNAAFPLPEGFITGITVTTIDSANLPVNVTSVQSVDFYSAYQPCCGSNVLVP